MNPLNSLVEMALAEDAAFNDNTTSSLKIKSEFGRAQIIAKEDLVLSGIDIATECFRQLSPEIKLKWQFKDGDFALAGQIIALLSGPLRPILSAERVALNFLGQMSGVATLTRCFVKNIEGTKTKILDTRKTTPLLRSLEKKAVVDGGGLNHRMNLADAILIKENHIRAAGGITNAVVSVRSNSGAFIEVEVSNLAEVKEAIESKADRILLDNMSNEVMQLALKIIPAGIQTEASGNMNLDRVRSVAELGVDFISVGALTHSAPCGDLSLTVVDS
jgi:nicotinate-nucleotide pyrophosphorylase (carboxylating)